MLDESLSYIQGAIETFKNTNQYWLHISHILIALIYPLKGEADKAYWYAEKAYEFLKTFRPDDKASSSVIYARAPLEKGLIDKARQVYKENYDYAKQSTSHVIRRVP